MMLKSPSLLFHFMLLLGSFINICDVLRDLVPFVQFEKREKHPWGSITFSRLLACKFAKSNSLAWVFTFFKLYKWFQIVQRITYDNVAFSIPIFKI